MSTLSDAEIKGLIPPTLASVTGGYLVNFARDVERALLSKGGTAEPVAQAMQTVTAAMRADPGYAWSWHCNIAMAYVDAGGDRTIGNQGAERFMRLLANVDPAHPECYAVQSAGSNEINAAGSVGGDLTERYGEMSREQLERHCARLSQAFANDKAHTFFNRYAFGPLAAPSCLVCGQLPKKVAIQHLELPGIVVCEQCWHAAVQRKDAEPNVPKAPETHPAQEPVAWFRGVVSPGGPWGPAEHDVEIVWGDQPDGGGWKPLYAAQD